MSLPPDRCPECGCTSHWRVRGASCRDCGHPAHAGVPPEPRGGRRAAATRVAARDASAALLLAVGGLVLLVSVGGPEYRSPGSLGGGIGFARDSTQSLGAVVGLASLLVSWLSLRVLNRIPPAMVACGALACLLLAARDVHDYEQVSTVQPTGWLVAFVAGAALAAVGAVRAAVFAARRGG